eukprot:CAMPEP_0118897968 /NCGR_PEP_ID=MMETSP1166-20130328/5150_1 /TAXON_ID=1104430 /ORGANISM="Chrysoreinhardia sp, Strain CCMP3193" /LENGTH=250 /DNA_ID=CAMNT_0006837047 /DNA_START=1 /DNA_END=749 /DNA_ORIENTATION=-
MSRLRAVGYGVCCLGPFAGALSRGDSFVIASKRRPPPVGLVSYPSGRVLLEWHLLEEPPAEVALVELGSGTGLFAVGAKRARRERCVRATDTCEDSLRNLSANVRRNGVDVDVARADARDGLELPGAGPVQLVGADLVFRGGPPAEGLVATVKDVLEKGHSCRLVLVDRWSGGAHAVLAALAGVHAPSSTTDPVLDDFARHARRAGLVLKDLDPDTKSTLKRQVFATLDLSHRLAWSLLGTFDHLLCCTV